jgi:hypothetical protein
MDNYMLHVRTFRSSVASVRFADSSFSGGNSNLAKYKPKKQKKNIPSMSSTRPFFAATTIDNPVSINSYHGTDMI